MINAKQLKKETLKEKIGYNYFLFLLKNDIIKKVIYMKRRSNGWGLNTLILMICVIIIALLTSTLFTIRLNALLGKNNNESETKVEKAVNETYYITKMNEMTLAVNRYLDTYNFDLSKGTIRINITTLISENYLNTIIDPKTNNVCSAYSEAYLNPDGIRQIDTFLRCDSYTTPNYRD